MSNQYQHIPGSQEDDEPNSHNATDSSYELTEVYPLSNIKPKDVNPQLSKRSSLSQSTLPSSSIVSSSSTVRPQAEDDLSQGSLHGSRIDLDDPQQLLQGDLHSTINKTPGTRGTNMTGKSKLSDVINNWWVWEITAWLFSMVSVLGIIVVLKKFENMPTTAWRFYFTLNTVVTFLSTIARSSLTVPLSSCIAQWKWMWFRKKRKLSDISTFEAASRGPFGSLKFVLTLSKSFTASTAAILTVCTLVIGTVTQQTVHYDIQPTSVANVTLPLNVRYPSVEAEGDHTDESQVDPMAMAAIYQGIFNTGKNSTNLQFKPACPTGNCTWPRPYTTLEVCSKCMNVSQQLVFTDNTYKLPNGLVASLNEPMTGFNDWMVASGSLQSMSFPEYYSSVLNYSAIVPPTSAIECILYFCVNAYNHTTVINGVFSEQLLDTTPFKNEPVKSWNSIPFDFPSPLPGILPDNSTSTFLDLVAPSQINSSESRYLVGLKTYKQLNSFLNKTFSGSVTVGYIDLSTSLAHSSSDFFTIFYSNGLDSSPSMFSSIAISLSTYLRTYWNQDTSVDGEANRLESYIRIRWGYLIFLVAIEILTMFVLITTIILSTRSSLGIWKDSPLALLALTLNPVVSSDAVYEDSQLELVKKTSFMQSQARVLKASLQQHDGKWSLRS